MTSTRELVEGISVLLAATAEPPPITLMNHAPPLAYEIICAVVERCSEKGLEIVEVSLAPEFAALMNIKDGDAAPAHAYTKIRFEAGLGRQVVFRKRVN